MSFSKLDSYGIRVAEAIDRAPERTQTMAMLQLYLEQCVTDMNGYYVMAAMARYIVDTLKCVADEGATTDGTDVDEWLAKAVRSLVDSAYDDLDAVRWASRMNEEY